MPEAFPVTSGNASGKSLYVWPLVVDVIMQVQGRRLEQCVAEM